jgi:hypothetical protein
MKELRGFAPIGILKYWNIGFCGILIFTIKIFHFDTHCSIIPTFHYSMGVANVRP